MQRFSTFGIQEMQEDSDADLIIEQSRTDSGELVRNDCVCLCAGSLLSWPDSGLEVEYGTFQNRILQAFVR